jgi:ATP-dependent Clp protease, protease subunit
MLVYGDIGMDRDEDNDAMSSGVSSRMFAQALAKVPNAKKINLHINSAGGSVFDAVAIRNQLAEHPAQTTAFVDGLAASAASVLAVGMDKTVMRQNSFMMIHQAWAAAIGDKATMLKAAEQLDKADETIAGIYSQKTEIPKAKVMEMMAKETWMTAREAVKMGFADQVRGKTTKAKKTSAKAFIFNSVAFDLSRFRKLPSALNRMKLGAQEKTPPNLVSDSTVILDDPHMTIDELKTKNPELYQQVYSLGQSEGMQREQNRIAQLDALLTPETLSIVAKAKLEGKQAVDIMAECFATVVSAKNQVTVNGRAQDARALNVIGADISDTQKIELTVQEQRAAAASMIVNAAPGRNGLSGSKTLK